MMMNELDYYQRSLENMNYSPENAKNQVVENFRVELKRIKDNYYGKTDDEGNKIKLGINDVMIRLSKQMKLRNIDSENISFIDANHHIIYIDLNNKQGRATLFKPSNNIIKIMTYQAKKINN